MFKNLAAFPAVIAAVFMILLSRWVSLISASLFIAIAVKCGTDEVNSSRTQGIMYTLSSFTPKYSLRALP